MEKEQRSKLQKATQEARRLLEEEFSRQLLETYDINVDKGRWSEEPGAHLQAEQRLLRVKLLAWIEHRSAQINDEKEALLLARREMAFTALNRFVALKLMEARELVRPCVSGGLESEGFQEFTAVAQGLLVEQEGSYRLYLETIFEDVSRELQALFDPRDPASLLWPKRTALLDLLDIINRPELAELWREDETLGWIYQYFNGDAERKTMRKESEAPRNSRELAVRNQFFTPRYVVEFLTDNTLGRIWYEMRQAYTSLKERCRYMVRRPNEIWLQPGEEAPAEVIAEEALSQEELLRRPVHIPNRPLKDPREIGMLDPACGSMHFGLYAFDLYLEIYEEAWEIAQGSDEMAKQGEAFAAFVAYAADFASKTDFLREVPRLILQHNIHGVDIDPRATQIARLTLWLRAQRAWQEQGVEVAARPAISRSNVVCAEPMPGERELLSDFVDQQFLEAERGLVQQLLETIFDKMQLAGEAGSLLKIEEEIRDAIDQARREWKKLAIQQRDLFSAAELVALGQVGSSMNSDLQNITKDFWLNIEERIYVALRNYAEQAEVASGLQRRLFAEDAAQGFALIDICRRRYSAVLMNPPFGEFTDAAKAYAKSAFAESGEEIDAAFVDRGAHFLEANGKVGVIANRTQLFKGVLEEWRIKNFQKNAHIDSLADLGYGVLDGAVVEASAFTLGNGESISQLSMFIRALDTEDKAGRLLSVIRAGESNNADCADLFVQESPFFDHLPARRIAYWISRSFADAFVQLAPLEGNHAFARQGLASADNFRFVRLAWEVNPSSQFGLGSSIAPCCQWFSFAKGGEYSPFFQDLHLLVNFARGGQELIAFPGSVIRNPGFYLKPALTYSERTASGFSPRALPAGCIFDSKGPIVAPVDETNKYSLLAFLMSRPAASFLEFLVAAGDSAVSGTAARQYTQGIVGSIPFPSLTECEIKSLERNAKEAWSAQAKRDSFDETGRLFAICRAADVSVGNNPRSIKELLLYNSELSDELDLQILQSTWDTEQIVRGAYGFDEETGRWLDKEFGVHPVSLDESVAPIEDFSRLFLLETDQVVKELIEEAGGGRSITKKCYFANRKIELLSQYLGVNARLLYERRRQLKLYSSSEAREEAFRLISYSVGSAFGRWDIRYATGEQRRSELPDPFAALPVCSPGMLQSDECLPSEPKDLPANYPLRISWSGIVVDDENHSDDIVTRTREAIKLIWNDRCEAIELESCAILGVTNLRDYFRRPSNFFEDHLDCYSKSRRQAPIYWQLSSGNGNYSAWLYYHRFTSDTLYRLLRDFVEPRIQASEREQFELESQGGLSGDGASHLQEEQALLQDLRLFKSELELVAPLWNPNLNDGVIINHAILWRITPHTPWQKRCKECWDKLVKGDYDWAHLAFHLWPERVIRKCITDRSLAIAHGLEERLWQATSKGSWLQRQVPQAELQALLDEHSKPAVQNALERFLAASPPVAAARTRAPRVAKSSSTGATRRPRGSAPEVDAETSRQTLLVLTAAPADGLGRNAIAELLGVEAASLTAVIKQLKEGGQIEQLGAARGAKYRLTESGLAAIENQAGEGE
jgi:hypothetical protein